MLSFMSDRRVLSVSAALITAAIFLFLIGTYPSWKAAIGSGFAWPGAAPATQIAPASAPAGSGDASKIPAASSSNDPSPSAPPAATHAQSSVIAQPKTAESVPPAAPPAVQQDQAATAASSEKGPTFDIVRVEPTGDSVVAARATAGAAVVLLDQGRPIARAKADANGQVAFVPPTLGPGEHSLMLSVGEPNTPGALSSQSVAVSVPEAAKTAPLVALIQPDQPTRVLSGAQQQSGSGAAPAPPPVAVSAIDVEDMGSVFATGKAAPDSHCRVYLNGSFIASVTAGRDGTWSLKIEHGMKPGHYAVRVDQVGSTDGKVQARAEVPFDYPARLDTTASLLAAKPGNSGPNSPVAGSSSLPQHPESAVPAASTQALPAASPADQSAASNEAQVASAGDAAIAPGTPTVVAQLLTTKVIRGDSLWRISRKMLGHGRRYTQIYAANTTQIRDPRLIYPGQIFVMPQAAP